MPNMRQQFGPRIASDEEEGSTVMLALQAATLTECQLRKRYLASIIDEIVVKVK